MEFNAHKPIYLQICSQIYEKILGGDLKADDRLLSVRDLGIELGVNPNTIMRSYEVKSCRTLASSTTNAASAISSPTKPRNWYSNR